MAITATIGTSKKVSTGDYGSLGATCEITVELEATPATSADEIQFQIQHYYLIVTEAVHHQLKQLNTKPPEPKPPARCANNKSEPTPTPPPPAANGPAKTNGTATPAPAKAPAQPPAKPNGTAKAPAAQQPTPPQPAAQRIALDTELNRQFAPPDDEPDPDEEYDPLAGDDVTEEDDLPDKTPKTALELLGWARHQHCDATQEIAQIGIHRGFPRLIKSWSPGMVEQALKIYRRTSRD